MSNPDRKVSGIDLSSASVLEVLNAYCAFRKTLNPSYSNDAIVRKVHKLEKEFSCTLMPMQITDIFYANFIQWAHETGNCYSTIKLYCNQLKAAMSWASKHGCLLSQTFNVYEVPRYFKSRVAYRQHITLAVTAGRYNSARTIINGKLPAYHKFSVVRLCPFLCHIK